MRRLLVLVLSTMLFSCGGDKAPKLLVLGVDGMDPQLLQRLMTEDKMPNFARLAAEGGFTALATSVPPQSPVAWSTFITGLDPDGHGIYDFVHRLPEEITPYLSTSREVEEGEMELLREGTPFWLHLSLAGIASRVFKVPANFPPRGGESELLHLDFPEHVAYAGMGTPDILGTYGTFSFYTDGPYAVPSHLENGGAELSEGGELEIPGGRVVSIRLPDGMATLPVVGPFVDDRQYQAEFTLLLDRESRAVEIDLNGQRQVLREEEWSDWFRVDYGRLPYGVGRLTGICLFYLKSAGPQIELYMSPVNIDPENPVMPVASPEEAAIQLSQEFGPYYTQGMPDDTKALEAEVFDYADFLSQDSLALAERRQHLRFVLEDFDEGFAFFYVHSLDQLCHMLWRAVDREHPGYRPEFAGYGTAIETQYAAMDDLLGQARELLGDDGDIIVMSDHGFAPYARAFNLNGWLRQAGYLTAREGRPVDQIQILEPGHVDWKKTRAYALGLNSLYLNQWGREGNGIVEEMDRETVLDELERDLLAVRDPQNGRQIIKKVYRTAPTPEMADRAPDLIIGYARGYRSSGISAVGQLAAEVVEDNLSAWSGDHCMAADEVPGILLSNRPLDAGTQHHLRDLPVSVLRYYGVDIPPEMEGHSIWSGSR
ncbi:MAG: alkaline phosphatase family protein [Candidatus Latescibacterota bacterium]|nr:alkaline phosphatase family protein [Candidatus Latescibacterota bacterium]